MVGEAVHFVKVVDQQRSRLRGWNANAIEVNLLAAMVGSQADEVAFVGYYIVELVLAEEAAQGGVGFALFLARLDRDGEVLAVVEVPADDSVRDFSRSPE